MSRFAVRICPNYLYNYRQTPEPQWILKKTETPTYFYQAKSLQNMTVFETRKKTNPREYRMDTIIDMNVSSATVFENELSPLIEKYVMKGLDITVLLVGSPLSGQRYSIEGPPKHGGLLYHSIDKIFHLLSQEETENQGVQFSCCHIDKKENITDALNPQSSSSSQQRIYYKEDPKKGVYISGLTKTRISHPQEVLSLFQHKRFRFGQMNVHTIFTLQVDQRIRKMTRTSPDQPYYSKLVEKHGRIHFFCLSLPKDLRGYISSQPYWNRCFNDVFDQIENGDPVVHFRKSKVTSFLKDSLLGYKPTLLVVNLSPQFESFRECIWGLRFTSKIHQIALKNMKLRKKEKSAASSRRTSSGPSMNKQTSRQQHYQQQQPHQQQRTGTASEVSTTSSQKPPIYYEETFSSKQKKNKSPSKRGQQPPPQTSERQETGDDDYQDEYGYDKRQDAAEDSYRNRRGYTDTEIQRRERAMGSESQQHQHERHHGSSTSPPKKKRRTKETGPPKGQKSGKRSGHPRRSGPSQSRQRDEPPQLTTKKKKKKTKKKKKVVKRVSTNDRYRDEEMYTQIMESRIKKIKDQCYNIENERDDLQKKYQSSQKRKRKLERELFHLKKEYAEKYTELDQNYGDMKLELDRVKANNRKMKKKLEDKTRIIEDKESQILQLSSNIDRTIGIGGKGGLKTGKGGIPIPSNLLEGGQEGEGVGGQTAILKEDEIIVSEKQFQQYEKYIQDAMQLNESLRSELESTQAEFEKTKEELEHARHSMEARETEIMRLNGELGSTGERDEEVKLLRIKNSILKKALADSLKKLAERNLRESGYDLNPGNDDDDDEQEEEEDDDDEDDKEVKNEEMSGMISNTHLERKRRIRELEEPIPMNENEDDDDEDDEEGVEVIKSSDVKKRLVTDVYGDDGDDDDEEGEEGEEDNDDDDDDVAGLLGQSFMKGVGNLVEKYKKGQQKEEGVGKDDLFVNKEIMKQHYHHQREGGHGEDTDEEMIDDEDDEDEVDEYDDGDDKLRSKM